jgi:hypothetical protein
MDFWAEHGLLVGVLQIIGYVCCPRLMLLFVTTAPFEPVDWFFFVVSPSVTVAHLAQPYLSEDLNPFLVVAADFVAFFKLLILGGWVWEKMKFPPLPSVPRCPRHPTFDWKGPTPDCATCLDIVVEMRRRHRVEWAQRQPKPKPPKPPPAECPVHGRHDGDGPPGRDCAVCHANYETWKAAG